MKGKTKIWPPKVKLPFSKIAGGNPVAPLPGQAQGGRFKLAGGLALAGLVLTQVPPSPLSLLEKRAAAPTTVEPALWQSTGTVRQSIVELYRARRLLIQSAVVSDPAPAGTAPASAEAGAHRPSASAAERGPQDQDVAAPGQASSIAASNPQQRGKAISRPTAPPKPAGQAQAPFDPSKTIDTNLEMRVAIAKNVGSLEVATSVDGFLMDLGGENYCNLPAQQSFILRPAGVGMSFGNCQLSNSVWLEPGEGGYVYVGDKWFKGRVLLLQESNRLTAVNFVLMHDYLSSVVGSEMYVHWPQEALKAQAVAARSYALTHHVRHANRAYDLDNTQRYQAYLGIAKETNTTQAAVAATTGEFISYDGGIVESLYAASDDIVRVAHGGNGMSQTGAMELASVGYSYAEILGNYYPGTALSRLVVK